LMTRNFYEWQFPGFDSQSPDFTHMNQGVEASDFANGINKVVYGGENKTGNENYWIKDVYLKNDVRGPQGSDVQHMPRFSPGDNPATAVKKWLMWTVSRDHHGKGRALQSGLNVVGPYTKNTVQPPAKWNAGTSSEKKALREEWGRRLLRWYWTAQFAVWSCEMLRLHLKHGQPLAPPGWAPYCAAWGIGVVPIMIPGQRETYVSRAKHTGNEIGKGLASSLTFDEWLKLSELVKSLAHVPGHPNTLGGQIARPGHERHAFDIPQQLGSAVPPLFVVRGKWNQSQAFFWLNKTDVSNFWTSKFLPVWNAVFSVLSSFTGSAAFSAWVTTATGIYTAGCAAMQAGAALASGESNAALDLVQGLYELTGKIGVAAGADVAIPDDLWDQLKDFSSQVSGFGGALADDFGEEAAYVQAILKVAHDQGYGYLDDLVSGLVADV
jgi:hypothetical protein